MNKYYFVHIPKTGGTYLRNKVSNVTYLGHVGFDDVSYYGWGSWSSKRLLNKATVLHGYKRLQIPKSKLITVIRDPFDFIGSYYHYKGKDGSNGWGNCNEIHKIESFDQFLDYFFDENFNWHAPHFQKNLYWQIFDKDKLLLEKSNIFYTDSLNNDITKFIEKNNLNWNFSPKNNNIKKYYHLYSDSQINYIRSKYKFLFEMFNF